MRQVAERDWKLGDYIPVATLNMTALEIESRYPVRFDNMPEDGLGMTLIAFLALPDGTQFILQQHLEAPGAYKFQTSIQCLNGPAKGADLRAICRAFGWSPAALSWVHPDLAAKKPRKGPQP